MGEVTSQGQNMDLLFEVPDLTPGVGDEEMKDQGTRNGGATSPSSATPSSKMNCIDSIPIATSIPFSDVRTELLQKGNQLSQMWADLLGTLMKYQAGLVSMEVKLAANGAGSLKPVQIDQEDCSCGGNGNCANTEKIRRIHDEMSVKDRLLLKCQRDLLATEARLTDTQKDLAETKEVLKQSKVELRSKNERLSKLEVDVQKLHEKVRFLQSEANTKDILLSKLQSEMVRDNGELTMEINKIKMSHENDKQHLKIEISGLKRNLDMERRAHDETKRMFRESERVRSIDAKNNNDEDKLPEDHDETDAMEMEPEVAGLRSRSSSDDSTEAQDLSTHGRESSSETVQHSASKDCKDGDFKVMPEFFLPMSTSLPLQGFETPPGCPTLPLMSHSAGSTSQALLEHRLNTSLPGTSGLDCIEGKVKLESCRGGPKVPLSLTPLTGIYRTGLGNSRFRCKSGIYRCTDCGNTYNHSSSLSRHRLVHRQQHLSCSWCNESFNKYIHLMQHRKVCAQRNNQNTNEYVMKLLDAPRLDDPDHDHDDEDDDNHPDMSPDDGRS
ncbi:uncharacterized protein LOC135487527 isoform X2 [Lineus longissimus]|uniref:uncharacterized protein LOC135487527 isoform X2 n=1 Tax=Lineus longissimus TaxID=88925 RepID=UPI00315D1ADB